MASIISKNFALSIFSHFFSFVFHNSPHCAKIPGQYNVDFIVILQEQREREKQDLELAKEMAEDDDDFP